MSSDASTQTPSGIKPCLCGSQERVLLPGEPCSPRSTNIVQWEIQDEPLTQATQWFLFYNLEIQQEKMEINTIEYFRILKERLLNLMELKLHRGVFISITLPHTPKRLHQFYLFNKLQEALHTTSHADDLIQSPLRKVRFPLTSAPLDVVERKWGFFPQRNWLMNLACLYHEIQ